MFIFVFICVTLGGGSKKILLQFMSKCVLPVFCSKSFIVSSLTLRSLTHFEVLNDTLEQMELIDIYRIFHMKVAEYTFFSSAHGTFSRMDHMVDHKNSLSKCKKIKIISSIFLTTML